LHLESGSGAGEGAQEHCELVEICEVDFSVHITRKG
jgi:hypothetical protein